MWRSCGCSADCVITDNCCADAVTNTEVGLQSYFGFHTSGAWPGLLERWEYEGCEESENIFFVKMKK